jgi:urate oxidase
MTTTARLVSDRYGKSRVRLMRLTRRDATPDIPAHHDVDEWNVQILLSGDFETAHTLGDNSKILPTDTMKNTVYFVARKSSATSIEDYAKELVDFLLSRNPQVTTAECVVESILWKRLTIDGQPFPTAFMRGSDERQIATIARSQHQPFTIVSGLDDLTIMKTANSGFQGYIKDELTTLPPTADRLFATALRATWAYTPEAIAARIDFNKVRTHLRETMLTTFAKHDSLSVQQTLYAMGEAALAHTDLISEITLRMPNKHQLLVDMSRFNETNPNHIFNPSDEPHGTIEATLARA